MALIESTFIFDMANAPFNYPTGLDRDLGPLFDVLVARTLQYISGVNTNAEILSDGYSSWDYNLNNDVDLTDALDWLALRDRTNSSGLNAAQVAHFAEFITRNSTYLVPSVSGTTIRIELSIGMIVREFGGTIPHAIDEYYGAAPGIPSGGTISMADFYGTAAIAPAGLYQIYNLSLSSSTSWQGVIQEVQSVAVFQSQFRVVFRYQNGTQGTSFRGDFQIHNVLFRDTSNSVVYSQNFEGNPGSYQTTTTNSESDVYSNVTNWSNIGNGTSLYRWNRDSGGTPSGQTGISSSNGSEVWYLYAETSGSSTIGAYYWLRSPTISWNFNNKLQDIIFTYGAYGNNVGTITAYIEVL